MNPSFEPYQMPANPRTDSTPAAGQQLPDKVEEARRKWLERLKQDDPGQRARDEIEKFSDWVEHRGERMSQTVQKCLRIFGPRR